MDAKLVVVGGKASKGEVKLKLPTVLGRSRDAGLAIAHPNVSRRHCEIREVEGALVVRDLGSSNGTLVNDEVIIKEVVLKPGDTLTVGPLMFRAEYKHAGKFPILGKKDPNKAAVADTLEFAPEEIAPKVDKPSVDKTVASERKAVAPPPAPEAKKPPAPEAKKPPAPEAKKTKPAKEDVETVAPGKLEKVSKPPEKPSDLDDLALPDLNDSLPDLEDLPDASAGKAAEVDDLADLPSIEEPVAAEWGELESAVPQDEADADMSLPSEESESLPDLSDDLDLPLPEAESLAEEPELESPEVPPLEVPAAESLESWDEAEAEDDLPLPSEEAESLPELSDDLDLPSPEAKSLAEEPELESPEVPPPEAPAAESLESWDEVEAEDDLALGDELPPSEDVEAAVEEPAAQVPAMELPAEESLEEFAPALDEEAADLSEEPVAALPAAEAEPLDELGLMEEMQLDEESSPASAMEEMAAPESAWAEELPEVEDELADVDDLPEMTLAAPEEAQEVASVEEELVADELDELGLAEELPPVAEAASEVPMSKSLEPDPASLEEGAVEEAELEAELPEVDDLPEMTFEEAEEIQEFAAVEEEEIEEEIGELGPIEEMPVSKALEPDPAWLEEPTPAEAELEAEPAELDDLPEMTLEEVEEAQEVAAAEEIPVEEEIGEMELGEASPEPAGDRGDKFSWEPGDLQPIEESAEVGHAELPPADDLEPTIDALPESEESLAEEDFEDMEQEPLAPIAPAEKTAPPAVDEESELDWLDGGSPEPSAAQPVDNSAIDDSVEPSLEELGLKNPEVEDVPAVRGDLPTATHEFTSVERSDATEEDLSLEPADAGPTDQAEAEPLEVAEAPPALPEMAAELPEEAFDSAEEAVEEVGAELPPALPWQNKPEETVAWSPSAGEPPPFGLQPEVERPAFFGDAAAGAASAKQPDPANKKKGWSLFGWLKKKEKPTKASSAPPAARSGPAPAAPLPIPTAIPEPSFEEAHAPAWGPESMPAEPPAAEFTPAFPDDEPEAALDFPEVKVPKPELADLEPELDLPQEMDIAGLPPAGDVPQSGDADTDEPEFAAVEPPLADLDESSGSIDVGPPVADVAGVPEWEPEKASDVESRLADLDEPEFAAVEPPLADLDESSEDIDVGPPVADLADVEEDSERESEPAESSETLQDLEPVAEDLAPQEPLEMECQEDELRPVETFDNAEAFDEELPDKIAPPQLPPVAEQAEPRDLPPEEPETDIPWAEDLAMMPPAQQEPPTTIPSVEMSDDPWADELAAKSEENVADASSVPLAEMNEQPWGVGAAATDQPSESADIPAEEHAADESPPAAPAWQMEHEETVAWTPATDDSPGFTLQSEENRPARYSEVEARAARANKPAPEPVKKKGWALFGWLRKKEKPTKASAAPADVPPAVPPQFAVSVPEPVFESEPSFEEAESPLSFPEAMPDEEPAAEFAAAFAEEPEAALEPPAIDMPESDVAEFEPETAFSAPESAELPPAGFEPAWGSPEKSEAGVDETDLDEPELEAVEPPIADLDEPLEELEELEPVADLPEWEPEPDELPEEAPSLEPVAEDLPPMETESDDLPPLEAVEEMPFVEEEVEELSEEAPPLGPPPVPHASESHEVTKSHAEMEQDDEQDATMQWSGDVAQLGKASEEVEEVAETPPAVPHAKPPVEPPAAATSPAAPASVEPPAAEDLPEFMRPKPTPKTVSGEDDDLNKFFQELGLK